jgi:hypothetical protein
MTATSILVFLTYNVQAIIPFIGIGTVGPKLPERTQIENGFFYEM